MINDDTKNMMILKAMYAAADELIKSGVYVLPEAMNAAKIAANINKGIICKNSNYFMAAGARPGYFVDFCKIDVIYDDKGNQHVRENDAFRRIQFNFAVDTFRCTVPADSLFKIIVKFEKLANVPSAKKYIFSPITKSAPVLLRFVVTKQVRALIPFVSHEGLRPVLNGIYIDTQKAVAVASDGKRLQACTINIELSDEFKNAPGVIIPEHTMKLMKVGDVVEVCNDGKGQTCGLLVTINGKSAGRTFEGRYPNWMSAFSYSAINNCWDVKKEWPTIKKELKGVISVLDNGLDAIFVYLNVNGSEFSVLGEDIDFHRNKSFNIDLSVKQNEGKAITIGMNAKSLQKLSGVEKMYFTDPSRPVVYTLKDGAIGLLMPMLFDRVPENFISTKLDDTHVSDVSEYGLQYGIISTLATDNSIEKKEVLPNIEIYTDDWREMPTAAPALISDEKQNETKEVSIDEKQDETIDEQITASNDVPEIASIPTVELNVIAAAPAIVDDVTIDETKEISIDETTDEKQDETIDEQITASNNLRLLRRIFAAAAVYFVAIFICCNIFGGHDTVKAATTAPQSTITAPADTCQYDTKKTAQTSANEGITAPADTCQKSTIKHDTKKRATFAPQSTITAPADTCQHDTAKTVQTSTNEGITAPADTCQHQTLTTAAPGYPSETISTTDTGNKTDDGSTLNSGNNTQSDPVPAANAESLTRYSTSQNSPISADSLPIIGSKIIH